MTIKVLFCHLGTAVTLRIDESEIKDTAGGGGSV